VSIRLSCLLALACACQGPGDVATEWPVESATSPLYRSDIIWPASGDGVHRIQTCFQASAQGHPDFVARAAEIRYLLEMSWSRFGKIEFTGFGNCAGSTDFVVKIGHVAGASGADGGFKQNANVNVNFDGSHFAFLVIHEFGHTLGFAHEQHRLEGWNFDAAGNPTTHKFCAFLDPNDPAHKPLSTAPGGIPDWEEIGPYDLMSVTHYFKEAGDDPNPECNVPRLRLSAGDISGVQQIYGRSTHASAIESLSVTVLALL
jgi:hypothetical protein